MAGHPHTSSAPAGYVTGVDLGGTKVLAALADLTGHIVAEDVLATDPRGGTAVAAQIDTLLRGLARRGGVDWSQVRATAVGLPGAPDPETGTVGLSPNVSELGAFDVRTELTRRLGHPVVLDNDVNMAAAGERWLGSGRTHRHFVFVAVGTGIGMGIVLDGELVRGARGAAGKSPTCRWAPIRSTRRTRSGARWRRRWPVPRSPPGTGRPPASRSACR